MSIRTSLILLVVGMGAAVLAVLAINQYGHDQHQAGYEQAQTDAKLAAVVIEKECNMNVIEQTPNTEGRYWRAMRRYVIWLACAASLMGCSAPMAVTLRIPEPAADLMAPAPTGSEVSARATANMQTWFEMLQGGPIK